MSCKEQKDSGCLIGSPFVGGFPIKQKYVMQRGEDSGCLIGSPFVDGFPIKQKYVMQIQNINVSNCALTGVCDRLTNVDA